jgi:HPt (histidine-containing phosphotransfer) domain-containing protein/HAMP domain-containing protein
MAGRIDNVKMAVMSSANLIEKIDANQDNARLLASDVIQSMLINESIYNVWLVFEPQAFDGRDINHVDDYYGAPSGRFMRSYNMVDGEIVVAPDMEEDWIDDSEYAPWYTFPRDTGRLYIDVDNVDGNVWDYGLGGDPVYTLSIVMPIKRDGIVIGCVGADLVFEDIKESIAGHQRSTVAVFYSSGYIFYAPDNYYAEKHINDLQFRNIVQIQNTFTHNEPLFLSSEYCIFNDTQSFTFFQPVSIRGYEDASLFIYVSTPRSFLYESLLPIFFVIIGASITVFALMVMLLTYIVKKVSMPIQQLTLAAEAISQGNIDTEIGYLSSANDEIGLLSQSLHRMVEQFRVHAIRIEQSQRETMMRFSIEAFIKDSDGDMEEAFDGLAGMFCEYFNVFKTTIMYINAGKCAAFSKIDPNQTSIPVTASTSFYNFAFIDKLEELLKGKRHVYMNASSIASKDVSFFEPYTNSACIIPLRNESNKSLGFVILENSSVKMSLSESAESIMMYVADILSNWMSDAKAMMNSETPKAQKQQLTIEEDDAITENNDTDSVFDALNEIKELDVHSALEALGGLRDVYEQSARLTVRLMPDTISKMDKYMLRGDINGFRIEIHGLKSVLRNIGAVSLGNTAAQLEKAAIDNDINYCDTHYPPFKKALTAFLEKMQSALAQQTVAPKAEGNKSDLLAALAAAKTAAQGFDAMQGHEKLKPFTGSSFSKEVDELLENIIFALEAFDCEGAVAMITKLELMLK